VYVQDTPQQLDVYEQILSMEAEAEYSPPAAQDAAAAGPSAQPFAPPASPTKSLAQIGQELEKGARSSFYESSITEGNLSGRLIVFPANEEHRVNLGKNVLVFRAGPLGAY
jgi:hypothetical protein